MKFFNITITVEGKLITFDEFDLDLGNLDTTEQRECLEELIDTTPDKDIYKAIDSHGTQELVELLTPWILENNPNVVEKDDDAEEVQSKEV